MSQALDSFGSHRNFKGLGRWRSTLIVWGVLLLAVLAFVLLTWNAFFVYVRPGSHLVITAKDGAPLTAGQVLAEAGFDAWIELLCAPHYAEVERFPHRVYDVVGGQREWRCWVRHGPMFPIGCCASAARRGRLPLPSAPAASRDGG